jgi:hypothetical protein
VYTHTRTHNTHTHTGIGTGEVVAGVLGSLSNRFSVQGEAMLGTQFTCFTGTKVHTLTQTALLVIADLESRAQPGKVHCSGEFMKILSTCARCRDGVLSRWHAQAVAPPVAAAAPPVAAVAPPVAAVAPPVAAVAQPFSKPTPGRIEESYMLTKQMRGWHAEAEAEAAPNKYAEAAPKTPAQAPHPSRDTCTT